MFGVCSEAGAPDAFGREQRGRGWVQPGQREGLMTRENIEAEQKIYYNKSLTEFCTLPVKASYHVVVEYNGIMSSITRY